MSCKLRELHTLTAELALEKNHVARVEAQATALTAARERDKFGKVDIQP